MFLDIGVGISESSTVMGNDVGHLVGSHGLSSDTAELELSFLGINLVSLESTFCVVEDSEELASLFNGDDVHDAERESGFSSDLAIDLDEAFLVPNNLDRLLASESVSQSVPEENGERNALSSFVGAGASSGSVNSSKFVQHPVGRSGHSLLMLLGSSCLEKVTNLLLTMFLCLRYILIIN